MEAQKKFKILVTDHLGEEGLALLRDAADVSTDIKPGIGRDELLSTLGDYDAIITRSGTAMDAAAISSGTKLRVIARAGVGVDNVDLEEASRRGIIVINTPTGNTIAATEQTMALMLSIMRLTPYAHMSIAAGEWDRKRFTGRQLNGRRLFVIGFGRIGSGVASRCRAFGMEVSAYDPYVSEARMSELGVHRVTDLLGGLSTADVITLHVPNTPETQGMLDERAIRAIKRGAYLINCARGGLVDEAALADALRDGRLAGAAVDVFREEPANPSCPLFAQDLRDRIVLTPHIGANTFEAQGAVAEMAISNTLAALRGERYDCAANLPFMETLLNYKQKNFLRLSRKMGLLAAKLLESVGDQATKMSVVLRGPFLTNDETPGNKKRPYTIAAIKGFLEVSHGNDVNYMIAPILASERGIAVEETTGEPETYRNVIDISVTGSSKSVAVLGTITEEGRQHIVRVNDYRVDFAPSTTTLLFQNHDRPGVIGKVGTMLGAHGVNIANFNLGRKDESGLALAAMEIEGSMPDELIAALEHDPDMIWSMLVNFGSEAE